MAKFLALILIAMSALSPVVQAETGADFGSTERSLESPLQGLIKVGQTVRNVQVGDSITHAEYAALTQITNSGRQSVQLGNLGNAVGGQINIGTDVTRNLSQLIIPQGLTALSDVGKVGGVLNLNGILSNAGRLYAYSSSPGSITATISANSIINQQTGVVSTLVPASQLGIASATPTLNLSLHAIHDIVNAGLIESSGSLNMTAGGQIVNAPLAGLQSMPAIRSAADLTLIANSITNYGAISSKNGDLNMNSPFGQSLTIDATAGRFEAMQGRVNIRDASFTGAQNINLSGGDYLSKQLNIFGGNGLITAAIGEVSGLLNSTGLAAHVSTDSNNLTLGQICMTGDPTFYNAGGSITLTGDISVGEALAIVAADDITNAGAIAPFSITARDGGGQGYAILLIAGATFTSSGGPVFPVAADQSITISNVAGGGLIDLSAQPVTINSNSTALNSSGGNISVAAFGGNVNLAGTTFNSSGTGSASNGDVTIIGGTSGLAPLVVNNINASGGAGGGGNVVVGAFMPAFASGNSMNIDTNGVADTDIVAALLQPHEQPVQVQGAINARSISIFGTGIELLGPLTATTTVDLDGRTGTVSGGGAIAGATGITVTGAQLSLSGKLTSFSLTAGFDAANSATLNTQVANLITLSGGQLTINEDDGLNVLSQGVSDLVVTSGLVSANDVFIMAPLSLTSMSVSALQGNIAVNCSIDGNVDFTASGTISGAGTLTGTNVSLVANSLSMFSKIHATNLTVGFNPAASSTMSTNVASLTTLSGGTLTVFENDGITLLSQGVTNLRVTNGFVGNGNVVVGADLNLSELKIDAITSGISLNNNVSASGNVELIAETSISGSGQINGADITIDGNVITSTGKITGNNLTVALAAGNSTTLVTSVNNLTSISGNALTINEDDGINLLGQSASNLVVNAGLAGPGNVAISVDLTVDSLTVNSSQGDLIVSNNITGSAYFTASGQISGGGQVSGNTVKLDANNINSTGKITATDLTVEFGIAQTASLVTNVDTLTSNSGGTLIVIEDDGIDLQIQNVDNLEVTSGVSAAGDVQISSALNMTSIKVNSTQGDLFLNNNITASDVELAASGLISGNGVITADDVRLSAAAINTAGTISADNLEVSFSPAGTANLNTSVSNLTASGGSLTINEDDGITLLQQDVGNLTVNAGLVNPGDVTAAVAINSGNVTLSSLQGDVAINADIVGTAIDIEASGTISGGGDLTAGSVSLVGNSITGTGKVTADDLTVGFAGGQSTSVTTNVSTITSLSGGTLTINEDDGIEIAAQAVSSLKVNAGIVSAGTVSTGAAVNLGNLEIDSAQGGIELDHEIAATDVKLTTSEGISGTGKVTADNLTVSFGSDDSATLNTEVTNLVSLSGNTLTINESSGINLMGQGVSNLHITSGGNIALNNDITAGDVSMTASGSISGPGKISATNLTVAVGVSESAVLQTDVATFTSNAGGSVSLTEANGLTLLGQNVGSLAVSAGQAGVGDIGVAGTINVSGALVLTNTGAGQISGSGLITADSLNITTGSGEVDVTTDLNSFSAAGTGNITVREAGNLTLSGIAAADFAVIAGNGSTIEITDDVVATGVVTLRTNKLINNHSISGEIVSLSNAPAAPHLTVSGDGTISSTVVTNLLALSGNLSFEPNSEQLFFGPTNLTANQLGQSVILAPGVSLTGADALNINTADFQLNGATISGNPLKLNSPNGSGTISNSSGDLILPASLTFVGTDLALLASGNVIASARATSIKLVNSKGSAGNLTIVAGFDFVDISGSGSSINPAVGLYQITGPSSTGGSVFMAKTVINTSSTMLNKNGGNVTIIARGGAVNAGIISLKSINTSANFKGGIAGAVTLMGQGGIQTGAINTRGGTGGAVTLIGATPKIVAGELFIANGVLVGPGVFTPAPATNLNGAGILVNGSIIASGGVQRGGNITLLADSHVEVIGGITSTGLIGTNILVPEGGGNVTIRSATSRVVVGGSGINTSALALKSVEKAGDGGAISISGGSLISVGKLQAKGGNNTLGGDAGHGGNVSLSTATMLVGGTSYALGNIIVRGFIDTRGGNAAKKLSGDAGNGGSVTLTGATVAIKGATAGASIITSAGLKGASGAAGTGGNINIDTYAIQTLPTNLDLFSGTKNVFALPGGTFTVGTGNPVNGTAGNIVSDATKITKKNNLFVVEGSPISAPRVDVTVTGSQSTVIHDGAPTVITSTANGKRQMVTPSIALALFQTSRGQAQGVFVNAKGQALAGGTATFNEIELNGESFSRFRIPAGVSINFTGVRPIATLPASVLLAGTLNFPTANSIAYLRTTGSLNVLPGASITADSSSSLILSTGPSLKNSGTIDVGELVLATTSSGMTFTTGANATTRASRILLGPSHDVGMRFVFTALKAAEFNAPVDFGVMLMPTAYRANTMALANNINLLRTVGLSFALTDAQSAAIQPIVGGVLNAASVNISSSTVTYNGIEVSTPLKIADGTSLTASRLIRIASVGKLTFGDDVSISAGVLKSTALPYADPSLLGTRDTLTAGSFTLTTTGQEGINFGSRGVYVQNGRKLNVIATKGSINLANDNLFRAMGGDVVILAKQSVAGGSGNQFEAKGTVKTANGGIEIRAGVTTSSLGSAFGKPANTQSSTALLGGVVTLLNDRGVVLVDNRGGSVDLSSTTIAASLSLEHGAILLGADGSNSIIFDGVSLETRSAKPVAFASTLRPNSDLISCKSDKQLFWKSNQHGRLNTITCRKGTQIQLKDNFVHMLSGQVFVEAATLMGVKVPHGFVTLKKGALVQIEIRENNVYIRACSDIGDVTVYGCDASFPLHPGQEAILCSSRPGQRDMRPADGIGRRNQQMKEAGSGFIVISDFSLLSMMFNLPVLRDSVQPADRKVVERLLKTAAAIDVSSRNRGPYSTPASTSGS